MEWKALANAIIHENFDPSLQVILYRCERCKNPLLHLLFAHTFDTPVENNRLTLYILRCPECGYTELDVAGTYPLPEILPGPILSWMGHFMAANCRLVGMAM